MPFTDSTEPVPAELKTDEFALRPIVAGDAEQDYAAVMQTREYLRLWEQSTWSAEDFTVEGNRKDLVDLEERHAAHRAFTYTVLDLDGIKKAKPASSKGIYIKNAILTSSMGPGIRISIS